MARCRAVSSSFMVSSAVRPLPVARGGRSSHEREPGGGHGYRREHRLRHQSRRCVVAPEREKLYDALSEKAPRCVVGSQIAGVKLSSENEGNQRKANINNTLERWLSGR